ncbi:MAG: hypothetical protein K6E33_00955 [Lachnospiraceae bacterium]|nr:hypothetical protein [Lachnospiraceae bacterium]
MTIVDDEESDPSTVSFSEASYKPEDGAEKVTVTVVRSGALSSVASVKVKTNDEGTALVGRDYSEVDRDLFFPFGVDSLTVDIPIRTSYFRGEKDFYLDLIPEGGCKADLSRTEVVLSGTWTSENENKKKDEEAELAETGETDAEGGEFDDLPEVGANAQVNTLSTIRTLDSIKLDSPYAHGNTDNHFKGNNRYESNNKRWAMDWEAKNTGFLGSKTHMGSVGVTYKLSSDSNPYWIAGARVRWDRSKKCAEMRAEISADQHDWYTNFGKRAPDGYGYYIYQSTGHFDCQTVDMYPSATDSKDSSSVRPLFMHFSNKGNCHDCNWLWIYDVKPILRPFQFNYKDPDRLKFKDEKGKEVADDGSSTSGCIAAGAAGQLVMFLGDSITIQQTSGSNVQKYAQIKGLEISKDKNSNYKTLDGVKCVDGKSVTFRLTEDSIKRFVNNMGSGNFYNACKENRNVTNKLGSSTPKYAELFVRPKYSKIGAEISLHNPYDFNVTVIIDGTKYELKKNETKKLSNYYLGDKIYTSVTVCDDQKENYTATGLSVQYKTDKAESEFRKAEFDFVNDKPVYITGTKDNRLNFQILTIEPKLQKNDNKIVVRVNKSDLGKFNTDEGVLKGTGTEKNGYVEYVYADSSQTRYGKLYPIPAILKDADNTVCRWYDPNAGKYYEGNTLYFTAGDEAKKNILILSPVDRRYDVKLTGSLRYMKYDLLTLDSGKASALPASGAMVVAGSGSAKADEKGYFSTASFPVHGTENQGSGNNSKQIYLRYLVTVNGKSIVKETLLQNMQKEIDVSSAFEDGVSPVTSDIFHGVQISGEYNDKSSYQVEDGCFLPIDDGSQVNMTVKIKAADYDYSTIDENGKVQEGTKTETPLTVQLILYGEDGKIKGKYDTVTLNERKYDTYAGYYSFSRWIYFSKESEDDPSSSFAAAPGDMLYMRVTTDRDGMDAYTYSDLYTGYTFKAKSTYEPPIEQGINSPVNINYDKLPFLSDTGMKLDFPFVTVGYNKTDRGYRMFIGASAVQIFDSIKGTHIAGMAGDDGQYWSSLFSLSHPFDTFKGGLKESYESVFKDKENIKTAVDSGSLGNPDWRFDLMVGMFFDFELPTASVEGGGNVECPTFVFTGLGGFVSVTIGFKMAWYFIVPVVFIPVYIGIEIEGTVMGFLGAVASGDANITLDDSKQRQVDFDKALDKFSGSVNGTATIQINMGVGLCGTIGVRAVGNVKTIVNYTPSDIVDDYGIYMAFNAGIKVDLFLTSFGKTWTLKDWKWGSFKQYAEGTDNSQHIDPAGTSVDSDDPFEFREGTGLDSVWLGAEAGDALDPAGSAFAPSSEKTVTLVDDAYERPDSQLITLADGTVFLAYISSDNSKGTYQRTTLNLASYKDGKWSNPVPVAKDDTADFQPSICEMKDGNVMVSWVSTSSDNITESTSTTDYLNSMDVFAAIAEIDTDGKVTVGEAEQLSKDSYTPSGKTEAESYYDCNPTVVCDMVSGDAMVYYIKSGRADSGSAVDLANPYTNDSVICYMPYSYDGVTVEGKTEHWLHDYFYEGEVSGSSEEEIEENEKFLIDNFGGQRFLDGPKSADGKKEYSIPDFTAIGYNSLAVYAYSVDFDDSMDTESDRELFLQVYDFKNHQTKYRIRLTDDELSDTMPQLFRAKVLSSDEEEDETTDDLTDTKLFWYRDNKDICYIDVSRLIREGIDENGNILSIEDNKSDDYDGEEGRTLAEPAYVTMTSTKSSASRQMADFKVTQDDKCGIYILWTEGANGGEEIFATSLLTNGKTVENADAEDNPSAGWSRPYQITKDGHHNDEIAVTLSGNSLMVVHNQFDQELDVEDESDPVKMTNMKLMATVLDPCGAVETEALRLVYPSENEGDDGKETKLPLPGTEIEVVADIVNAGLTTAKGYKAELKTVSADGTVSDTISSNIVTEEMIPQARDTVTFTGYTLPEHFDGLKFLVETTELKEDNVYYSDHHEFYSREFEERGDYAFTDLRAYQLPDGFHLAGTVTNYGNAAAKENDCISVTLNGPYNLQLQFDPEDRKITSIPLDSLAVDQSMSFDVPVTVNEEQLKEYGYIEATVAVYEDNIYVAENEEGYEEINKVILGESKSVYFEKEMPTLSVNHMLLDVDDEIAIEVTDTDGNAYAADELIYEVEDDSVARLVNGSLEGLKEGKTSLRIIHSFTGCVINTPVIVAEGLSDELPENVSIEDVPDGLWYAFTETGDCTYTGKKITPEINVFNGYKKLKKGKDYTVSYKNNVNAYSLAEGDEGFDGSKAPVVIVKGKGNYTDKDSVYFKILPIDLGDDLVIADDPALAYTGKDIKVKPVVKWNGKKLKAGKDFTASVETVKEKGNSELTLTGTGNYTGTKTLAVTVYDKTAAKPVSKLSVSKIADQTYTGSEVKLSSLTVRNSGATLSGNELVTASDADYFVSYKNNVDAGTGYVIIKGNPARGYVGSRHIPFKIVGADLKGATVYGLPKEGYAYTGSAITLNKLIKDGTITIMSRNGKKLMLSDGTETGENYGFTVSYSNNTDTGKATAILTGVDGCTGTLKVPFKIAKVDVAQLSANLLSDVASFAQGGSVPGVVVRNNGKKLSEGVDYTLVFKNNKKTTTNGSTVTVKGKGNFAGLSQPMSYSTVASDISNLTVVANDVVYKDKNGNYLTKVTVTDSDGKKLKAGKDYEKAVTYTYEDGTAVEANAKVPAVTTLNVTVKAVDGGNYKGEVTGSYRVGTQSISKVGLNGKIPDQTYTGKAITISANVIPLKVSAETTDGDANWEIREDSYRNNVNKGSASVTVRGLGEYCGDKKLKFKIGAMNIKWYEKEKE